jgi:hypothetical protein
VARPRALPDNEASVELHKQHTYNEITAMFAVTMSAVAWRFRSMGLARRQQSYKHLRPWRVKPEHEHAHPSLMLRLYGRNDVGVEVETAQMRTLVRWMSDLEGADVVVGYDPDYPPNPASPRTGGWFYVKRRKGLDQGIIREPDASEVPDSPRRRARS